MKYIKNGLLNWLLLFSVIISASCTADNKKEQQAHSAFQMQPAADTRENEWQPQQNLLDSEQQRIEQQNLATATAITYVLRLDAAIPSSTGNDYTATARAMRDIDLSQCPQDFVMAYTDHVHAWENAAKIDRAIAILNSDDSVNETLIKSLLSEIFDTGDTPIRDAVERDTELRQRKESASETIRTSFQLVEKIAVKYGATLP